jgi:CPA2 family monovalent cation:H+ antiporter-2
VEREAIFLVFLIVVAAAVLLGLVSARLRQPVIMGYLVAGLLLGRLLEGRHIDPAIIQAFADFGVSFLMFSLGVHFSFRELIELRRIVVRGGLLQIGLTLMVAFLIFRALGLTTAQAFVLAGLSAISSSVIGFTLMELRGTLNQPAARPTAAILLAQDIGVPLVAIIPALVGSDLVDVVLGLGKSIALAVVALLTIAVLSIRIVPWLLFQIARVGSRELFLLAVVLLAIGTAVGSEWAGLSFALGAFLAGIVVSESEFSYQVLGGILPLRDVFGVMFFAALGLLADPIALLRSWPIALATLIVVTVIKGFLAAAVVAFLGYSPSVAIRSGAFLAQIGEFSFVLGLLGLQVGILDHTLYNAMIGAAIASLLLNTFLLTLTERARWLLEPPLRLVGRPAALHEIDSGTSSSSPLRGHVVIAGYGRSGREVGRVLQRRRFRFVVIDRDPVLVRDLRRLGIQAIYGDVANEQVILAAHITTARVFVVAVPDAFAAETAVRLARTLNATLDIIARADRRAFVARLVEAGATEVVHPSFEAGLEMVRHTLHRFGMSMQEIQAIVAARRIDYYEEQGHLTE